LEVRGASIAITITLGLKFPGQFLRLLRWLLWMMMFRSFDMFQDSILEHLMEDLITV
jgi:hypothetical protein